MTAYLKKLVRENFHGFTFFYKYLGWRVFALFVMSFLVGLFDGFSLALFMPLLELIGSDERLATGAVDQLGSLSFLIKGFDYIGVPMRASYILLAIFTLLTIKAIFKFLGTYIGAIFQQKLIRKIRLENIDKIRSLKYEAFISMDAGQVQNSLSSEVDRVNGAFTSYIKVLQFAIQVLVYTLLAFLANPQFAILVIIGSIISNRIFNLIYKATKNASLSITNLGHQFHGLLIQFIANMKYFKATGSAINFSNKLGKEVYSLEKEYRRLGFLGGIIQGIQEPLAVGVVIFVILLDLTFLGGELSGIVLSVLFLYRALSYVMTLQSSYNGFLSTYGSIENLKSLQQKLNEKQEKVYLDGFSSFRNTLSLNNVSFSYGDKQILSDISFEIKRNTTVAIVGASGSGKTTTMNLLSGLISPSFGKVLVDGIDLEKINKQAFQTRIGYITQESIIFNDSIFNNVTLWENRTVESELRFKEALKKASAYDYFNEIHEDYNINLGDYGVNLSGGQKQRIALARELYKDIDILLMDEGTSGLDKKTETLIKNNIDNLKGDITIIIIAHSQSLIDFVDRVIALDKGKITFTGTYKEYELLHK